MNAGLGEVMNVALKLKFKLHTTDLARTTVLL